MHHLEAWLELNEAAERGHAAHPYYRSHHLKDEQLPVGSGLVAVAHSSPSKSGEEAGTGVCSILEEELEDSGLSPSTTAPPQQELSQNSDWDSTQESESKAGSMVLGSAGRSVMSDSGPGAAGVGSSGSQPVVRPKKRRKSYRSFLPEGGGYPDIGFPLFPLSKGFVKSVRGVLLQYRAALTAAGVPEHTEDK